MEQCKSTPPFLFIGELRLLKNYRGEGMKISCRNGGTIHILERKDMHCFSFVMVYGLSSNMVVQSISNQFFYVNKNLLHFLNIKQQFFFMS